LCSQALSTSNSFIFGFADTTDDPFLSVID